MEKKKRELKSSSGKAFVACGFNNTVVTITDSNGGTLCWATPGMVGFSGTRRSTPFAASATAQAAAKKAVEMGLREVAVYVKGPGIGRDAAIKSLKVGGLQVSAIADVTPIPHNGCRPKKRRRV